MNKMVTNKSCRCTCERSRGKETARCRFYIFERYAFLLNSPFRILYSIFIRFCHNFSLLRRRSVPLFSTKFVTHNHLFTFSSVLISILAISIWWYASVRCIVEVCRKRAKGEREGAITVWFVENDRAFAIINLIERFSHSRPIFLAKGFRYLSISALAYECKGIRWSPKII